MRGQRHAPAAPYPRERPGTHCTEGWMGLRAGLDWCGKSRPTGIRSPERPARRQSLYRLRYPAHVNKYIYLQKPAASDANVFPTSHAVSSSYISTDSKKLKLRNWRGVKRPEVRTKFIEIGLMFWKHLQFLGLAKG